MIQEQKNQLRIIDKTLKKYDTCPAILAVIQKLLHDKYEAVYKALENPGNEYELVILQAVHIQQQLGKDAIIKGLMTNKREKAQQL